MQKWRSQGGVHHGLHASPLDESLMSLSIWALDLLKIHHALRCFVVAHDAPLQSELCCRLHATVHPFSVNLPPWIPGEHFQIPLFSRNDPEY